MRRAPVVDDFDVALPAHINVLVRRPPRPRRAPSAGGFGTQHAGPPSRRGSSVHVVPSGRVGTKSRPAASLDILVGHSRVPTAHAL